MLEEFPQVFAEPYGLPPSRGKEHVIVLNPGSKPVSVRPFRYPQAQKEKIEKQVTTMLAAGIIRDSEILFSSPVLLIKKKDGNWRFYVEYRALNKATVLDSFSISLLTNCWMSYTAHKSLQIGPQIRLSPNLGQV